LQLLVVDTLDFNSKDGFALFGNYVFAFFDKSFSYTGFEVGKIILLCIQNSKKSQSYLYKSYQIMTTKSTRRKYELK